MMSAYRKTWCVCFISFVFYLGDNCLWVHYLKQLGEEDSMKKGEEEDISTQMNDRKFHY